MSRILSWCRWWRTNAASLPVMRPADHAVDPPAGFRRALAELRTLVPRSEIELLEAPAPQRLAPYAIALTADVIVDDEDRGTGRLVLLHDPRRPGRLGGRVAGRRVRQGDAGARDGR
jgi:hypothetical protein